jgi:hypothetical protein
MRVVLAATDTLEVFDLAAGGGQKVEVRVRGPGRLRTIHTASGYGHNSVSFLPNKFLTTYNASLSSDFEAFAHPKLAAGRDGSTRTRKQ